MSRPKAENVIAAKVIFEGLTSLEFTVGLRIVRLFGVQIETGEETEG